MIERLFKVPAIDRFVNALQAFALALQKGSSGLQDHAPKDTALLQVIEGSLSVRERSACQWKFTQLPGLGQCDQLAHLDERPDERAGSA